MYKLESEESFIVLRCADIIDGKEAKEICLELVSLFKGKDSSKLIVDAKGLNLDDSKVDIFITYLSKIDIEKIALVLSELVPAFKFKLWRRKYKNYVEIEQFLTLKEAQKYLAKEK